MTLRKAVSKVKSKGMLLVFPMNNKKEPLSLWSQLFPKKVMRWEWDESNDQGLASLWFLREKLSRSRQVIYTKWYRGRATLISLELFKAMLRDLGSSTRPPHLSRTAQDILEMLYDDSPLSTKTLKHLTGLQGRSLEKMYVRSLKELWSSLLIVAYGEVDEGSFPSIAVGSSKILFEELWRESRTLCLNQARQTIDQFLPDGSLFRKYYDQLKADGRDSP